MGDGVQGVESLVGTLSREVQVRVLNCGPQGCLIEASRPLEVGSVARLDLTFGGQLHDDVVKVVRCQPIKGAGATFHVAVEFVATTPAYAGTLRHGIRAELDGLHASLRA